MKRLVSFFFLALLLMAGCKPSLPAGVISESKMEDILVDYHLAQGMADVADRNMEEHRYRYIHAVFAKYNVTEAQFDSSLVFYCTNSELMSDIYKKVRERVKAKAEMMGVDASVAVDQYAHLTDQGDTANIWAEKKFVSLLPNPVSNVFRFSMKADSSFYVGDSFIWHMRSFYVVQTMAHEAYAQLIFTFENDTVASVTNHVNSSMIVDLNFTPQPPLDTMRVKSVAGFVYVPLQQEAKSDDKASQVLLLTDISFIRMHKQQAEKAEEPLDTLAADTTLTDTLVPMHQVRDVRLSPMEKCDIQPREHKINIVKENPVSPAKTGRTMTPGQRLKQRR